MGKLLLFGFVFLFLVGNVLGVNETKLVEVPVDVCVNGSVTIGLEGKNYSFVDGTDSFVLNVSRNLSFDCGHLDYCEDVFKDFGSNFNSFLDVYKDTNQYFDLYAECYSNVTRLETELDNMDDYGDVVVGFDKCKSDLVSCNLKVRNEQDKYSTLVVEKNKSDKDKEGAWFFYGFIGFVIGMLLGKKKPVGKVGTEVVGVGGRSI